MLDGHRGTSAAVVSRAAVRLAADPLLLPPEEAAQMLRVGRTTIYALMKAGDLRPIHIGRSCRLSRAEQRAFWDALPQNKAEAQRRVNGRVRELCARFPIYS